MCSQYFADISQEGCTKAWNLIASSFHIDPRQLRPYDKIVDIVGPQIGIDTDLDDLLHELYIRNISISIDLESASVSDLVYLIVGEEKEKKRAEEKGGHSGSVENPSGPYQ